MSDAAPDRPKVKVPLRLWPGWYVIGSIGCLIVTAGIVKSSLDTNARYAELLGSSPTVVSPGHHAKVAGAADLRRLFGQPILAVGIGACIGSIAVALQWRVLRKNRELLADRYARPMSEWRRWDRKYFWADAGVGVPGLAAFFVAAGLAYALQASIWCAFISTTLPVGALYFERREFYYLVRHKLEEREAEHFADERIPASPDAS